MPEHSLGPFSGKIDGLGPFFFWGGAKKEHFFGRWPGKKRRKQKERKTGDSELSKSEGHRSDGTLELIFALFARFDR